MISSADRDLLDDLTLAEDARALFRELKFPVELWEAFRLARSERDHLRREMDRLNQLRKQGRSPTIGGIVADSIDRLQRTLSTRVAALRRDLRALTVPMDDVRTDIVVGFLLEQGTVNVTEAEVLEISARVDRCRMELLKRRQPSSASVIPDDINRDLLEDLRQADRLRRSFGPAAPGLEAWESVVLSLQNRASAETASARLREAGADDGTLIRILERALDLRARSSRLALKLRNYEARLPIGQYGRETMDLALGFMMASDEGRSRATQWLEDPERFRREAAIRIEGVIGKAQKYQAALRASPAA